MFGIFIDKYFPTTLPHQGSGQDNGKEPTIWVMISAILLTIMQDEGFGLNALSCLSQLALVIAGFAFVDDTEIINATPSVNTTCEELLQQQQRVVDTWEGTLRTTGGALRPDKSYWYMIDYQHTGIRWLYRSINQIPGGITVKVADSSRQPLLRLEPNQTKETLGIFVPMRGNAKDQILNPLSKTGQMAEYLRTWRVEKQEAWYTFTAAFLKTIEYPMEATRLTKPQWEKLWPHFFPSRYKNQVYHKKSHKLWSIPLNNTMD